MSEERRRVLARERSRRWRERNPGGAAAKMRKHRETNRERAYAATAQWFKDNPHKAGQYNSERRARVRRAEGVFTEQDVVRLYERQGGLCVYCPRPLVESCSLDHKDPLSRGGTNDPSNLQLTCVSCNSSKNARTHEEFLVVLAGRKGNT